MHRLLELGHARTRGRCRRSGSAGSGRPSRCPTNWLSCMAGSSQPRSGRSRPCRRRCAGTLAHWVTGAAGVRGRLALDQHGGADPTMHPALLHGRHHERVAGVQPDVRRRVVARRSPCTAAGLPPISTVVARPEGERRRERHRRPARHRRARSGSGPGAARTCPLIRSPSTTAGCPIARSLRQFSLMTPPLTVDLARRPRSVRLAVALIVALRLRLDADVLVGVDLGVAARLDLDVAVGLDREPPSALVEQRCVTLPSAVRSSILSLPSASSKTSSWPLRVLKPRVSHRAVAAVDRVAVRRRVDAVVEPAEHERAARVAVLEGDQHLVVDLGQDHRPRSVAGAELQPPGPSPIS